MRYVSLLLLVALPLGVAACGTADFWYFETNNLTGGPTILIVRWSDAPVDTAERVEITLDRLELLGQAASENVVLADERRTFDLLELRNGRFAELARSTVPAGTYRGLRFVLAPAGQGHHRVRAGGVDHELLFAHPGAGTVDVAHALDLPADAETILHVDFNVRMSVTEAGGVWRLAPTLGAVDPTDAGSLAGEVRSVGGGPIAGATVSAQRAGLEIHSTQTGADGTFRLGPLPPGRYTLVATAPGHAASSIAEIPVLAGVDSDGWRLDLAGAAPGAVAGSAPAGRPGLVVRVLGAAGLIALAGVDPLTGVFDVPALAPGTYTLVLWDGHGPVDTLEGVVVTAGSATAAVF